jgi:26S proteasome regulatory subunit N1
MFIIIFLFKISNPKIAAMDLLLKLAHDPDNELSYRSVLCLGILGAGTNNSRIADILRGLAVFNSKDANGMFMVRVA